MYTNILIFKQKINILKNLNLKIKLFYVKNEKLISNFFSKFYLLWVKNKKCFSHDIYPSCNIYKYISHLFIYLLNIFYYFNFIKFRFYNFSFFSFLKYVSKLTFPYVLNSKKELISSILVRSCFFIFKNND